MAKVEIVRTLFDQINKKFKQHSIEVFQHLKSLESSPYKGKPIGNVGGIIIKELKYKGFRFYFITDGFKLKYSDKESLINLLIRFVMMSDKRHQQKIINDIKHIIKTIGVVGFE